MSTNINKSIEDRYQAKDEIEHILDRSGMWISSGEESIEYPLFVPSKNMILPVANTIVKPALIKIFDEILSNSIDAHRDSESLFKPNKIVVTINEDGFVGIRDNGGISVMIHKKTNLILPEMLFGTFRTSSNYDDTVNREGAGTNGYGAKLTNVYSKSFTVETADSKNMVRVEWSNNMRSINKDLTAYPNVGFKLTPTKEHYTNTEFLIDLERFELDKLPLSTIRIMQKRCIAAAASNPNLTVEFISDIAEGKLNSTWVFSNFTEYVRMFITQDQFDMMTTYDNKKDTVCLLPKNLGFNVGIVNGSVCPNGTHISKIEKQITKRLLDECKAADMELITEKDILSRMTLFINTTIYNPTYESQSKTKLTNKITSFGLSLPTKFLDSLKSSELFQQLKDFYTAKYAEVKAAETRKLNAVLKNTKSKKLLQANITNQEVSELWLFEGDSASTGFRTARTHNQAAYILRGKIRNTFDLSRAQILTNNELKEVIACLGIQFGAGEKNLKTINYRRVIIGTDMDVDGNHICGLFLAFFAKHFPELIKAGIVCRAISPIVVAFKKTGERKYYYDLDSYNKDVATLKGWIIIYTKGLGGLEDEDYYKLLQEQRLIQFTVDDKEDMEYVTTWFGKSTAMRRDILIEDGELIEAE